jgi:DNA-binding CsgD family transcriptional regulator/tetratricopeptide (TPR) repeat protein
MDASTTSGTEFAAGLLERSAQLEALGAMFADASEGRRGRLALISGEAGVGKTVLVRAFCDDRAHLARVLWGACDALFTPRPLGPFVDVAAQTGGELGEVVRGDAKPYDVAGALIRELESRSPTVLVLDDLHWADEATLDVLALVGRRIGGIPALVVGAYRDDELSTAHPLRTVLGELATVQGLSRTRVEPLSAQAVASLARPYAVDPTELFERTAGNPFFVTEVLATGGETVPVTVRDAVLARAARLSAEARHVLEAVAVIPVQAELWLMESLAGAEFGHLGECLAAGMLTAGETSVGFRHELARLAIEESLGPDRRLSLHRMTLAALAAPPTGSPDPARLAHHAEAAADRIAVLEYAPSAAKQAASLGAHREAMAQYARALRFAEDLSPAELASLLECFSFECYLTGRFDEGLAAQERAVGLRHEGDPFAEAESLRAQSRLLRFIGRTSEASVAGRAAVTLLERLPESHELAMAYDNLAHICVTADDTEPAIAWATRALELAEQLDDVEARAYALGIIGGAEILLGKADGLAKLELSVELARHAGLDEQAGRAFLNLVWWPLRNRWYSVALAHLSAALEYCDERGLDVWRVFLVACRARIELDEGRWEEAAESATDVIRDPRTWPVPRVFALAVLGLVRARRGDPEVWAPLDEAWTLAAPTGELQRIGPAATARAEAVWLEHRVEAMGSMTDDALDLARRRGSPWFVGELACWRRRAGIVEEPSDDVAEPYARELAGDWKRAAGFWKELGCPYESALSLAQSDEPEALRRAHDELQGLGARPAAAMVAHRLRRRGVRGLSRGPRPATRENPAGLTVRELEVLELLADGLRNAQIAERLVVSQKTVDHHASAILRKLEVRTRGEAAARARALGLVTQDR